MGRGSSLGLYSLCFLEVLRVMELREAEKWEDSSGEYESNWEHASREGQLLRNLLHLAPATGSRLLNN